MREAAMNWIATPEQQAARALLNSLARHAVRIGLDMAVEVATVHDALEAVRSRSDALLAAACDAAVIDDGQAVMLTADATLIDRTSLLMAAAMLRDGLRGRRAGAGANDPEDAPLQYAQYAAWQQDASMGEDGTGAAGQLYWQRQYAQLPAPLRVPDALAGSGDRHTVRHALHAVHRQGVAALANRWQTSAERVVQAAWWSVLARVFGQQAFSGVWLHDCRRDYDVMTDAIGVFEKALPVAIDWTAGGSLLAQWERHLAMLGEHAAWQEAWTLPAGWADQGTRPRIACTATPAAAAGVATESAAWPAFDVVCEMQCDAEGVAVLAIHAEANVLHPRVSQWLLAHLAALLRTLPQALDNAETVENLAWPLDDTLRVPQEWREAAPADAGDSILARIARHAMQTPQAPALQAGDVVLDYASLQQQIAGGAALLRSQGVVPGSRVALSMPRSGALVVALLSVWAAGAAYVPLDPAWPAQRRQRVLAQAAPVLVVTDGEAVAAHGAPVLDAGALLAKPAAQTGTFAVPGPAEAAYVLFTSGSTGEPKGVVIGHAQISHYTAAVCAALGFHGGQRFALTSSVAADLGNTTLFGALWQGACLVVASEADMAHPDAFAHLMREQKVDVIKIVPSHLAALLETDAPAVPATVVLGGEVLPRALVAQLRHHAPACRIFNHYGPTETTVGVLVHAIDDAAGAVPLTRALGASRIRLLDARLQPVPPGAAGQLFVGGPQLAHGYLNRSDLDAAAFVADPDAPGERLYRTGDVARVTPGGLQLIGRADQQVKIRGIRIEPAEVETALLAEPGVVQAVVVADAASNGETSLLAFVAPATLDVAALRQALSAALPDAMVPANIVALPELPRLPNGKIDRALLKSMPVPAAPAPAAARAAPADAADAVEALVSSLMTELLGDTVAAPDADFFALGGHSLLVIKLVARLRRRLQLDIAPGLVFDHPTPRALAAALRAHGAADLDSLAVASLAASSAALPAATSAATSAALPA